MRAAALLAMALLAGCFGGAREPSAGELAVRQQLLQDALGQIGRPYRYGGGDGEGFDCSGLTRHVYADAGIVLPRTAAQQLRAGERIDRDELLPGDLVFFRVDRALHVTLYVGEARFVHAPSAGKDVRLASLDSPYWRERYVSGLRVLR